MVLEEKAIPHRIIEENLSALSSELLALHPEGRVPVLVHETAHETSTNRQVIYQSTIITEYLDEVFGGPRLMPADAAARAQVRLWSYWCDEIFKPDLDLYKYELSKLSDAEAAGLRARLSKHLSHWDSALRGSDFLVTKQMTLADIHLFPFARQFFAIKPPLPGLETYSAIAQWLERMTNRPAFARVMSQ